MLRAIARKEVATCWRDGRVRAGAAAFLLLGCLAIAAGALRATAIERERVAAQRAVADQWLEQGEKNPHSAAHYGQYAFRPAPPLAFFDPGVSSFDGVSIWLEAHKRNFATARPADDLSSLSRFGELSLAFVLQILLPLATILLGYGAFASERENGTLRQVLATGVPPARLLIGKFLGIAAVVALLLAPLLLVALVALAAGQGSAADFGRLLLVFAAYALYGALFLLLTLVVSAYSQSNQTALLVLLTLWALTCFAVPRLAADLGRLRYPTPAATQLAQAIEASLAAGIDGATVADRVETRRQQLLALYKVARVEDLPINFQGIVFGIQDEVGDAVYDQQFGRVDAAIDAQVDVYEAAGVLSPRIAVALISQAIAGTGLAQQRGFATQAERFRRELMTALNRDILYNARPGEPYRAGADLWRNTGLYRHQPQPLGAALRGLGPAAMVLVLWSVALLGLGVVTARRLRSLAA
jgi:ABC-2 type transport system permease protein